LWLEFLISCRRHHTRFLRHLHRDGHDHDLSFHKALHSQPLLQLEFTVQIGRLHNLGASQVAVFLLSPILFFPCLRAREYWTKYGHTFHCCCLWDTTDLNIAKLPHFDHLVALWFHRFHSLNSLGPCWERTYYISCSCNRQNSWRLFRIYVFVI
jgi:hypothetical protein